MKQPPASGISIAIVLAAFLLCGCRGTDGGGSARPSAAPRRSVVDIHLEQMTLEEKIGQMLIIDLFYENGEPILDCDAAATDYVRGVMPGGVVFYGANLDSTQQVKALTEDLQAISALPLFIAVDHEGGVVNRFDDSGKIEATELPSAAEVGRTGDTDFAGRVAETMARELKAFGINMNFAPVADVLLVKESVIGSRAYGSDPRRVAEMVRATVLGLQRLGVSAVAKHYPGHGAAVGDTHSRKVVLKKDITELASAELIPFASAIDAGIDAIMAAHIVVGKDPVESTPATTSSELLTENLRTQMGFGGIIITDSLTMKAAEEGNFAVKAVKAGADVLLRPVDPISLIQTIVRAIHNGELTVSRIDGSVRRILQVKARRGLIVSEGASKATFAATLGATTSK